MGKIVQIIDSFYDERLSFRICEVVGTYNNPFAPPSRLDKYVSFENIFLDCELSSPYAHGCQTDITHYFDSLSLMHDIQILLKRSCFLVEPSKTATFSDLVKVVGKRIKNEKHKFGVLYENGKLESHWLTNEEINNKTR